MEKINNQSEVKAFGKQFLIVNFIVLVIVTPILFITVNKEWGFGYLIGSLVSYITFGMHLWSAENFGRKKAKPYLQAFLNAGSRFIVSGLILLAAYFLDFMNIMATFIGLVAIKLLLIIYAFVREIVKNKKNNKGSQEAFTELETSLDSVEGGDNSSK